MITAVIGDVHGCSNELRKMLSKLDGIKSFVFLGDLVDKGPDSAGVIKIVRELTNTAKVICVKGNHEEKHERFRKKLSEGKDGSDIKDYKEISRITNLLSSEDISFMEKMPLYYKPFKNTLCVHGGIPSTLKDLPEMEQVEKTKDKKFFNQILRLRYEDPTGRMVSFGKETPQDTFWAERYDGRFGHVYYGHQPYKDEEPRFYKFATGIDLGCVFGGSLAAAIIENDKFIDLVKVKGTNYEVTLSN
jgi:serine/threonine protein phosphatase 1